MSKGVNRLLSRLTSHGDVAHGDGMVRCYDGPFIRIASTSRPWVPRSTPRSSTRRRSCGPRVVEIPAHLDWSDQKERMRSRKVSLQVSTTSKLLMFSSFLFRPIVFFVIPGLVAAVRGRSGRSAAWPGRSSSEFLQRRRQHRLPAHPGLRRRLGAAPALVHRRRVQLWSSPCSSSASGCWRRRPSATSRRLYHLGTRCPPARGAPRAPRRPRRAAAAGRPGPGRGRRAGRPAPPALGAARAPARRRAGEHRARAGCTTRRGRADQRVTLTRWRPPAGAGRSTSGSLPSGECPQHCRTAGGRSSRVVMTSSW